MDTPPDSEVMKVSNSANILSGCRLKEPPTRQESSHPENPNLYPRALLESDASTHRSTFDLAGRNKGPATAVAHSLASRPWGLEKQEELHSKVVKDDDHKRLTSPNHSLAPSTLGLEKQEDLRKR